MKVRLVEASPNDLDTLWDIEIECFKSDAYPREMIRWMLLDPYMVVIKAIDDKGEVMGFIAGRCKDGVGIVFTLDVRPRFRKMGIGRMLMEELEKRVFANGCDEMILQVEEKNREALRLYEELGYRTVRFLKDYYGIRRNAYEMRKKLSY